MLGRLFKSFQYAARGLRYVFREEENFYLQVYAAGLVIAAGWILDITRTDWLFLIFAIVLVLGSEILNTILEDVANELQPNHHPLVGKAKDMMAAFVLLSAMAAFLIGCFIFLPLIF
ncbi:MAG: diacylglycerol kinase family protein [Patescibacteria group bacterium]